MPNLSNTVTFLFAGDGSLASEGLSVFLQTKSDFLMISECTNGASAIADIEAHSPEIAVIDAQLPDMTAGQIIDAVRARNLSTRIIVLGTSSDIDTAGQLLSSGADAYIVRNGPSRHLNDAIRHVREGGKYLAPQLTKDLQASAGAVSDSFQTVGNLRSVIEAQSRTVERLELAIRRTERAIELLHQEVSQLGGHPLQSSTTPQLLGEPKRGPMLKGLRSNLGAVAVTVMMGIVGFMQLARELLTR